MSNQIESLMAAERRAHVLLLGTLGAVLLVASTGTKNERAVFLTEGTGLPAKAFAALVPADQSSGSGVAADARLRAFAGLNGLQPSASARALPLRRGPSGSRPPQLGGVAPATNAFVPPSALNAGSGGAQTGPLQLAALPPAQFAPPVPQFGAGGGGIASPAGGGGGGGGGGDGVTPGDPTTPIVPSPTPTTQPTTTPTSPATPAPPVVGAVPEPGTWAMLLFGFFAIGAASRRKPASLAVSAA